MNFYQTGSWEIISLVAFVHLSALNFVEATLCTTSLVQSYIAHHWPALSAYLLVSTLTLEHYQSVCLSVISSARSTPRVNSWSHESTFVHYHDIYVITSLWHQSGKKDCKHWAVGGPSTLWHFNVLRSVVWSNWDDLCVTCLNPPI